MGEKMFLSWNDKSNNIAEKKGERLGESKGRPRGGRKSDRRGKEILKIILRNNPRESREDLLSLGKGMSRSWTVGGGERRGSRIRGA